MQITRVELKNIKNHAESSFTFQPGVIAICGPNGSGKTTILEAIAWALFDHLDYKREDFLKRGTKKGQVVVGFISDQDGREYLVTRDTAGGYFVYDPATKTRLVEQKNQVLPWLRQRLGVDPGVDLAALFRTTLGVPQGTFTYDFTLAPAHRKNVFDQILKVEEYRQAADQLRVAQRLAETRIVDAEKRMAAFEGELKVYEETRQSIDQLRERLAVLSDEQARAVTERDRLSAACAELDGRRRRLDEQRGLAEQLRVRLESTREKCLAARAAAQQAREASAITDGAREGYRAYLEATSRLGELETRRGERDRRRNELTALERELFEARSLLDRSRERLQEIALARAEESPLPARIEQQAAIEREIASLREGRGEAQSLRRSLEGLEGELEKLRGRYQEFTRQIEEAESRSGKAALIEPLERERDTLEEDLQRQEVARESRKLKTEQRERWQRDLARLSEEEERRHQEVALLESMASPAGRLMELEARQHALTQQLAHLRAELARDREMIAALESGGICPLLTEKCLNLRPGESLDGRFRAGLDQKQREIAELESSLPALAEEVGVARRAAVETARLPQSQRALAQAREERETLQTQLTVLEAELASLGESQESVLRQLRKRRSELEKDLREAREAQRLLHQAEVLREGQAEVKKEGETKRHDYDLIVARLAALGDVETRLVEAERELADLGDPRGRARALRSVIEQEPEWLAKAKAAETTVATAQAAVTRLNSALQSFDSLEADLAAAGQSRARSEQDYQSFIAHEKLAATLTTREEEAGLLEVEVARLEASRRAAAEEVAALESAYDPEEHRRRQNEFDLCREQVAQFQTQLAHLREQFALLEAQLAHLDEVREQMHAVAAAREKLLRLREKTEMIREFLIKAAPYITESYLFSISHEANQLYREITGRYDVTLRWTREYEITIEEDGYDRPFLSLSGGEQMAAALAVRLALLKELSEIDLAFFDEPTTNMDEERRRNLAQQLRRIRNFQQLFVISHDDSFEGFTDQSINLGQPARAGN